MYRRRSVSISRRISSDCKSDQAQRGIRSLSNMCFARSGARTVSGHSRSCPPRPSMTLLKAQRLVRCRGYRRLLALSPAIRRRCSSGSGGNASSIASKSAICVRRRLLCQMLPKRSNNCSLRRANRSDWILQDPRQYLDHSRAREAARQHCAREECPGSRRSCHRNIECPGRGPFASATVSSAFPAVKPLPGRP